MPSPHCARSEASTPGPLEVRLVGISGWEPFKWLGLLYESCFQKPINTCIYGAVSLLPPPPVDGSWSSPPCGCGAVVWGSAA